MTERDYPQFEENSFEELVLIRLDMLIALFDYFVSMIEPKPVESTAPIGRGTSIRVNPERTNVG